MARNLCNAKERFIAPPASHSMSSHFCNSAFFPKQWETSPVIPTPPPPRIPFFKLHGHITSSYQVFPNPFFLPSFLALRPDLMQMWRRYLLIPDDPSSCHPMDDLFTTGPAPPQTRRPAPSSRPFAFTLAKQAGLFQVHVFFA